MDNETPPKNLRYSPPGTDRLRGLIGLFGPTNSGKTYSALRMATGIREGLGDEKSIAMVDTEYRGQLYERRFKFDRYVMEPPYSPDNFVDVFKYLDSRHSVIVIDNFSDEHEGIGGLIDMADEAAKTNPNKVGAWSTPKAHHKTMMQVVRNLRSQFIFLLRAVDKIQPPEKGEKQPKKLGWLPVCEKNFDYDIVLSWMLPPHGKGIGHIYKTIEGFEHLQDGVQITEKHGHAIAEWIKGVEREPDMKKSTEIRDENNVMYYGGTQFTEALKAYATVKKAAKDKMKVAIINVHALEFLLSYAKDDNAKRLEAEITGAREAMDEKPKFTE